MREIRDVYRTVEERKRGAEILKNFQREAATRFEQYIKEHEIIRKEYQLNHKDWDKYMEQQRPIFEQYLKDDEVIWNKFVTDAKTLGYYVGDE